MDREAVLEKLSKGDTEGFPLNLLSRKKKYDIKSLSGDVETKILFLLSFWPRDESGKFLSNLNSLSYEEQSNMILEKIPTTFGPSIFAYDFENILEISTSSDEPSTINEIDTLFWIYYRFGILVPTFCDLLDIPEEIHYDIKIAKIVKKRSSKSNDEKTKCLYKICESIYNDPLNAVTICRNLGLVVPPCTKESAYLFDAISNGYLDVVFDKIGKTDEEIISEISKEVLETPFSSEEFNSYEGKAIFPFYCFRDELIYFKKHPKERQGIIPGKKGVFNIEGTINHLFPIKNLKYCDEKEMVKMHNYFHSFFN
jgi:hypothetical protein